MKFHQPQADIYVPDSRVTPEQALARTTHLCIAAHQDDIEVMAYSGIAECYQRPDKWFSGVIVTNGAGSPRSGVYANFSDEQMQAVRREEQRKAAHLGDYSVQIQLDYPSATVKTPGEPRVLADLAEIFRHARPETVYLHQPADKHDTHVATLVPCIQVLRTLPADRRPKRVLGCEVWRDLDWLVDADKVALDVSARPHLAAALIGVFDSQIAGGKRYDLGLAGRRAANATFHTSHATDQTTGINWAMDLTPLIANPSLSIADFTAAHIDRLRKDVVDRVRKFTG